MRIFLPKHLRFCNNLDTSLRCFCNYYTSDGGFPLSDSCSTCEEISWFFVYFSRRIANSCTQKAIPRSGCSETRDGCHPNDLLFLPVYAVLLRRHADRAVKGIVKVAHAVIAYLHRNLGNRQITHEQPRLGFSDAAANDVLQNRISGGFFKRMRNVRFSHVQMLRNVRNGNVLQIVRVNKILHGAPTS